MARQPCARYNPGCHCTAEDALTCANADPGPDDALVGANHGGNNFKKQDADSVASDTSPDVSGAARA